MELINNCMLFFKLQIIFLEVGQCATKLVNVILSHVLKWMVLSSAILLDSSFWSWGLEPWFFEPVEIISTLKYDSNNFLTNRALPHQPDFYCSNPVIKPNSFWLNSSIARRSTIAHPILQSIQYPRFEHVRNFSAWNFLKIPESFYFSTGRLW